MNTKITINPETGLVEETIQFAPNKDMELSVVTTNYDDPMWIELLQARLLHCKTALDEALKGDFTTTKEHIVWNGGHFSVRTYAAMQEALQKNPKEWEAIIWNQLAKQYCASVADGSRCYNGRVMDRIMEECAIRVNWEITPPTTSLLP